MSYRIFTAREIDGYFAIRGPYRCAEFTGRLSPGSTQHSLQEWRSGALDTKSKAFLYSTSPMAFHHIGAKTLSALAPRDIRGVTTLLYLKP